MIKEDKEEVLPGIFVDVSDLDDLGDIYNFPFLIEMKMKNIRRRKNEVDILLDPLQNKQT